jgi:hypothetical protein
MSTAYQVKIDIVSIWKLPNYSIEETINAINIIFSKHIYPPKNSVLLAQGVIKL